MTEQTYLERSQSIRRLLESDTSLLNKLKEYDKLEVLSDRGNFHRIYRLGSVRDCEATYHIAVRHVKIRQYNVNEVGALAQGNLEYCAQEYAKRYDNGNRDVPSFAIGVNRVIVHGYLEFKLFWSKI